MNNLTKYDNQKSLVYVQSIEKAEDTLLIRKKIAEKEWLKSISEFIDWRAIAHKDNKRMLINEKGEFLKDESIMDLKKKTKTDVVDWRLQKQEQRIDGNKEIITDENPTTNIVQTKLWIFPPRDGIIIVVNDRKYAGWVRLYTTQWVRIPIPEWRDFDQFAIVWLDARDEFSKIRHYYNESINHSFDYRDNILEWLIPVQIQNNYFWYNEIDKLRKIYNLYNWCGYTLVNTKWQFLKTELGYFYANTKRWFDFSQGLYPSIDVSFKTESPDERIYDEIERPIFYMVNKEGKAYRDEFNEVVYSDDPYRINNFSSEGYTALQIEPKVRSPDKNEKNPYICFLHKSWSYIKNTDWSIKKIYFKKYIYTWGLTDPDVKWYHAYWKKWILEVLIERNEEDDNYEKRIYKKYNYSWNEIIENEAIKDKEEKAIENIDFWPEWAHHYQKLWWWIIQHWYNSESDIDCHDGEEYFFWGETKFINTDFNNQAIKFPDWSLLEVCHFDDSIKRYKNWYIIHWIDELYRASFLKINGLIARYAKDDEWNELKSLENIEILSDEFLAVQFKNTHDYYYILDKNFSYIKDPQGNKLKSKQCPLYINGQFLMYTTNADEWRRQNMELECAYFKDGTLVWATAQEQTHLDIINQTKVNMTKLL